MEKRNHNRIRHIVEGLHRIQPALAKALASIPKDGGPGRERLKRIGVTADGHRVTCYVWDADFNDVGGVYLAYDSFGWFRAGRYWRKPADATADNRYGDGKYTSFFEWTSEMNINPTEHFANSVAMQEEFPGETIDRLEVLLDMLENKIRSVVRVHRAAAREQKSQNA